jgi:hypothetical protein
VDQSLVGIFVGKNVGEKELHRWMEQQWKPLLGYVPDAHVLSKGWYAFILESSDHCKELLKENWSWGPSSLSLKPWTMNFDPTREPVSLMCVWAILPGLPLAFWSR